MRISEALSILGNPKPNNEAVKRAYREKAKQYHPDKQDGNLDMMVLVNLAYEVLKQSNFTWTDQESRNGQDTTPLTETIANLWESIRHYKGLHGEIIGSWLWVSGDTYPIRDKLKVSGFKFSHYKKAWYFHEGDYWKRSRRKLNLQDLRGIWGNQDLETEEAQELGV